MLPRLDAQRELSTINAITLGFGGVKPADRQRYLGRLERMANGWGEVARATPATLAAMGVSVVMVPMQEEAPRHG